MIKNKYLFTLLFTALLLVSCQSSTQKAKTGNELLDDTDLDLQKITSYSEWFNSSTSLISAHRGGPYPGYPENAIETFRNIADKIPLPVIECDVSMTKDSVLILMHDKTLNRTTTGTGDVSDYNYQEIEDLFLVDEQDETTNFHIPTLDQTLSWGKGNVLFTLDVKRGVPFHKVIDAINTFNANSYAAVITYRIKDAELVHELNPDIIISVSAGDSEALEQIEKSGIPAKNLLGFVGTREPQLAHYEKLKKLGIKTILGTLGNLDKSAIAKGSDSIYLTYIKNGANIIATDRPLEVAEVLNKP